MHRGRRSILLLLAATTALTAAIVAACSDSHPPGAAESAGGTHFETVDGGGNDGATSTSDAGTDGGDAAVETGFPCLDDTSVTIDGGAGATGCPSIASCSAYCTRIAARYKLGVAQTAIDCIRELGTCSDPNMPRNCVDLALGRACSDPTATTSCTPLVTSCDPNAGGAGSNISENDCELLASALTSTGRTVLSTCLQGQISAGTCPDGVVICTAAIRE